MHLHCICVLTPTLVCEMDTHAFALQMCIAHLCVHLPGNDNDCHNSNTTNTTATCEGVQAPLQRTQQGQSLVMKTCTRACDGARVKLDHQEKHALQWHLKKKQTCLGQDATDMHACKPLTVQTFLAASASCVFLLSWSLTILPMYWTRQSCSSAYLSGSPSPSNANCFITL